MPQTLNKITPNLVVADVERSMAFYRDILGFAVQTSVPDEPPRVFAILAAGGVELFVNAREAAVAEYPSFEGRAIGGTLTLFMDVTGIRAAYDTLKDRVTIAREEMVRDDGVRLRRSRRLYHHVRGEGAVKLIAPEVEQYLEALVPARGPELQQMEAWAREHRFPIIGPACGHLCYQLARMIGARRVFELGSGYGYSTAFFARAVRENGGGRVYHVVWDEALSARARGHLSALGYADLVEYRVGEAVDVLTRTDGPFDLIFNDIEKDAYPASLPAIEGKLRSGGLLVVDNMLWSGAIFDADDRTAATEGVRELTRRLTGSPSWTCSLVPIRDGLIVAMKT